MSEFSSVRGKLSNMLAMHGLATLDSPSELVGQIGFLVQDHDHLRQLLTACVPEERVSMYEALRPNLRFEPKPLDVYLSESGRIAAQMQWPLVTPDGKFRAYQPPDVRTVQTACAEAVATGALTLVCRKCTRETVFRGVTEADAVRAARDAGWTYGLDPEGRGREICPDCPC